MSRAKSVNSVIRASRIMRCLAEGKNTITEINEDIGLSKGTIYRLLRSLVTVGFVVQDPISLKYYLGPLLLDILSDPAISHGALIVCASNEMKWLRDYTRETVLLHVRSGVERLCTEQFESPESIKYVTEKGATAP